ncbi:MAG: ATP-binding cassette domain-containing protein [Prevotella sp.]|jgi:ATPase subunit of ABC transporter with duplicated ATPase domains|nr:ATP-binding cassette domain-containing protein [Prevotella sp.]
MSIIVSDISYRYFDQEPLLEHISFSVLSNKKVSLIGNNGTGKSTLLKLLAGELMPSSGSVQCSTQAYYISQQTGVTEQSVAKALGVSEKINALHSIYNGSTEQIHYDQLADDWDIESRCRLVLDFWGLTDIDLNTSVDMLSGGEKSKVFLAGLLIHKPDIILLDEPTNHLDQTSRQKFYGYILDCKATVIIASHDVTLLNKLDSTYELSAKGIKLYGGNYTFYKEQKNIEEEALMQQINSEEKQLRAVRRKAQEMKERQNRRIKQGENSSSGTPRIVLGMLQESGENTRAKLNEKHSAIISGSQQKLTELRQKQQVSIDLKIDIKDAQLYNGKLLFAAVNVNFGYTKDKLIWKDSLNLEVRSGERIRIIGDNGAGKTTFVRLLMGEFSPPEGEIKRSDFSYIYLDQQYSRAHKDLTVLDLAREHNTKNLLDHEIKLRLNRALFPQDTWDKNCLALSGGERMRLYLCCLMISNQIPDIFILDEPTNNLDLASLSILTNTVRNYQGTILVISHDQNFIDEIGVTKVIELKAAYH